MKRLLERAVVVTFVPLALALAALGVREATRDAHRSPISHGRSTEFVPPLLFLAASAPPGVDQVLQADAQRSSARVVTIGDRGEQREQGLRAEGSVRILADETLAGLELDLQPRADALSNGWPRDLKLHIRTVSARCHATGAPGVRACTLRCTVVLGGVSRDTTLALTWMRLPGGAVELHAVAPLDWAPFGLPESWSERMLPGNPHYELGLDLVLHAEG
ncbi:MAG: hypothetical protein NTY35_03430 [Planctomycetota bacterium]|nr:hypothetical protein [Planctomycetota bacterium]